MKSTCSRSGLLRARTKMPEYKIKFSVDVRFSWYQDAESDEAAVNAAINELGYMDMPWLRLVDETPRFAVESIEEVGE